MAHKPCLLLACRKVAYQALSPILVDCFRMVHSVTLSETLQVLARETDIDAVLSTVSFDEHRMFDLLREVKARYPALPFIACRVQDTELNAISLEGVRIASQALGAVAFVDLTELAERYGDRSVAEKACGLILAHLPPSMRR